MIPKAIRHYFDRRKTQSHEKTCDACPFWALSTAQQGTIRRLVEMAQAVFPAGFDAVNHDPEQIGVSVEENGFSFYLYHSKMPVDHSLVNTLEAVTDHMGAKVHITDHQPAKNRCRVRVEWNAFGGAST